jgi:hypothetical protein
VRIVRRGGISAESPGILKCPPAAGIDALEPGYVAANEKMTSRSKPLFDPIPDPNLSDDALLEAVQRQTFRFFWDGAHQPSGCARDRQKTTGDPANDIVTVGGTGFGVMAIVIAVERRWISRAQALGRLDAIIAFLEGAERHHGAYPHFLNGRTGAAIPFSRQDDGVDLVETALLFQGLICAQTYFDRPDEARLRDRIDRLWEAVNWTWFARGERHLTWHWSPNYGWDINLRIAGWNECLIAYVLAAGSQTHPVDPDIYHDGFVASPAFRNGKLFHGVELPLGVDFGGPLFFAHYSFCGLDPRGMRDRHADYWEQNVRHARINHAHCVANPHGFTGYGPDCWGLTASHGPRRYGAHSPLHDIGVITPSAALSSFPYLPNEAMCALRGFLRRPAHRIWGRYGFVDAFCDARNWYARTYLAVDQGPIVAMIENHRTGLLWRLFMQSPQAQAGLTKLGFQSPWLAARSNAARA